MILPSSLSRRGKNWGGGAASQRSPRQECKKKIWHWALAWIQIQIQDLEVLKPGRKDEWSRWATIYKRFHFLLKDSFITYSDAAVFYYKSDWETTVELWLGKHPPPPPPHILTTYANAGTQMWIPTWRGRAKKEKISHIYFTATMNLNGFGKNFSKRQREHTREGSVTWAWPFSAN